MAVEALRRISLARALVDVGVVLLAIYAGGLIDATVAGAPLPDLAPRGFSLAAGIVFVNVASGFYGSSGRHSLAWAAMRSLVALAVGGALGAAASRVTGTLGDGYGVDVRARAAEAAAIGELPTTALLVGALVVVGGLVLAWLRR